MLSIYNWIVLPRDGSATQKTALLSPYGSCVGLTHHDRYDSLGRWSDRGELWCWCRWSGPRPEAQSQALQLLIFTPGLWSICPKRLFEFLWAVVINTKPLPLCCLTFPCSTFLGMVRLMPKTNSWVCSSKWDCMNSKNYWQQCHRKNEICSHSRIRTISVIKKIGALMGNQPC